MPIEPRTDVTIDFLENWRPSGPWALTAIKPDGPISTKTFTDLESAKVWIDEYQGLRNLYFHVNPIRYNINTKAEKKDISALEWLHIDIDPREGEDLETERKRAFDLLVNFTPMPTVIIDSGGGFQGFWKLTEPIPIDGDIKRAEELEAYNMQLEILFGADACHNVDRIMRLPGTINLPNARKLKKGRKPALSKLVKAKWTQSYSIEQFTKAARVTNSQAGSTMKVQISGNLPRLNSVDDLPEKVLDRTKMLIVQGNDPDDPTKYPSRSEVVFAVCCDLVRAEVDNNIIAAVLLDPDFGISESVLAHARPERYAARQIERAKEVAVDPILEQMNGRHAVISDIGGKCRIISEIMDNNIGRTKISMQSFQDFRNRYCNLSVLIGKNAKTDEPLYMEAGKWWINNKHRRQFETLTFAPGREIDGAYNLWRGFACDAIPGECELYLEHILTNICGGNEEYYDYLIGWMALAVQKPASPGLTAIVLRGKQGTGKSFFAKEFGSLWGRHFLQVSDPKHLVGSFNAHLRDCVVLFGDEAFYAGDKKHESVLKMLITEEFITIEAKGVDAEAAPNFTHIILASNNQWVIPAGTVERRFFVVDVGDEHQLDIKYFAKIIEQMNSGGREALLYFLQTYDLSKFNVRSFPKTDALFEQKIFTLDPAESWWVEKLFSGQLMPGIQWTDEIYKTDLHEDYCTFLDKLGIREKKKTQISLTHFLRRICPVFESHQVIAKRKLIDKGVERYVTQREYNFIAPSLDVCRAFFDENFGGPYKWEDPIEDRSLKEIEGEEAF